MKVRILLTTVLSPDGITTNLYRAGEKYDVSEEFARRIFTLGVGEEDKDMGGPPEVKAEPETIFVEKKRSRKKKGHVQFY